MFDVVIGLEVHVQLATRSKLFCPCRVEFGGVPNSRICPVCTGQPGALPVLNERALELAIRAGLALNASIRTRTKFDRKNYFYPDLPKGYQISQYDEPIAERGFLTIEVGDDAVPKRAEILRAHIEEDAGKVLHPEGESFSQVDLNRAGIPLVEIVGEPDLCSPEEAGAYLIALRRTLRYAGVSECDMEKGSMRCDANISLRRTPEAELGTKVEVKNMNSVRNVERALHYEIERQSSVLSAAGTVVQETRSFRDGDGSTRSMRAKEEADDYRYFPDPDLPPFDVSEQEIAAIRSCLPESFGDRRRRLTEELGLGDYDARLLTEERELSDWFDACVRAGAAPKAAANWIQTEILAHLGTTDEPITELKVSPAELTEVLGLVDGGELSHQAGRRVLQHMLAEGGSATAVAEALDLRQIRDTSTLDQAVDEVLAAESKIVADYRAGKKTALNALLGRVMKNLKGKGDPGEIRRLLGEKLDA